MCAIVAVLRRRSARTPPAAATVLDGLDRAVTSMASASSEELLGFLSGAADCVEGVDRALRGVPGAVALLERPDLARGVADRVASLERALAALERGLEAGGAGLGRTDLDVEAVNRAVIRLKDALWAVGRDRLGAAEGVRDLGGAGRGIAAVEALTSIQTCLSALDRLEVRGRDSAGLHVLVTGHGLDLDGPELQSLLAPRASDPLFTTKAVRAPAGHLSLVYKAAAEVGELGDNTRALRQAIREDPLLARALEAPTARAAVLGHTRWASVGIISEANAHPVNSEEIDGGPAPYVVAALNGDVDNHAELRAADNLRLAPETSTDAKVIPVLVSRRLAEGLRLEDAFRRTVASFEGSVAVAAHAAAEPSKLLLALRGSGQGLYVGLADDAFVVASEPYGLVEQTSRYLRLDGEAPSPRGARGQVVVLDGDRAGSPDGVERLGYDGTPLPVTGDDVHRAEITTRDIDRRGFPHFLLKEISEAPESFRKTLRGRVGQHSGRLTVSLPDEALPAGVRARLRAGEIRRLFVIGQGTAAIAGQSVAASVSAALARAAVPVVALPATELSGHRLDDDLSDALVVAVSQSGTTTDTNRTVDLVRARGAVVVAIVNRRNSDLVEKADGVLYTSDGRDVEMSVASTKAFYAQVAAGALLALALAREMGVDDREREHEVLAALRRLPAAMSRVLEGRARVAVAAAQQAPERRHWAVVGSGPNRVAAQEIRIKLSELCYKSIACDATEDKKHIDLSSEPLVVVGAAGMTGPTADDVAKEVAIYRAHKAAPVLIASEGEHRFDAALHTIFVPTVHPDFDFVLTTMAGHLFAYEAAVAIDAQARLLREARGVVESVALGHAEPDGLMERLHAAIGPVANRFAAELGAGRFNGNLEASTAVRVASLLRYAAGVLPLEAYELEYGKVGTPGALLDDLADALTRGIEELTRPVDAIKHQAKTVTVGVSRSEEALFDVPLVRHVLGVGAPRGALSYRALRTLVALGPAVAEVTGHTRYRIEPGLDGEADTIHVVDQGGVAAGIESRTTRDSRLRGTKHRAAVEREVTVARGRADGRVFVLVPETKGPQVHGLTLLHVRFVDRLAPEAARSVLAGYRNRLEALVDLVAETEGGFDESRLGEMPVEDLLVEPLPVLADRWRTPGGSRRSGGDGRAGHPTA